MTISIVDHQSIHSWSSIWLSPSTTSTTTNHNFEHRQPPLRPSPITIVHHYKSHLPTNHHFQPLLKLLQNKYIIYLHYLSSFSNLIIWINKKVYYGHKHKWIVSERTQKNKFSNNKKEIDNKMIS